MKLVKALQIANESGWKDKALLLFEHLVEVYSVLPKGDPWTECALKIREKIAQNCKLNFDGQLGNCLGQFWPIWASTNRYRDGQYSTLLCRKKIMLSNVNIQIVNGIFICSSEKDGTRKITARSFLAANRTAALVLW
jgi:hypothetical protein